MLHVPHHRIVLVVLALFTVAAPAQAQSIQWRTDYNRAWQEATTAGRPLFVDVGSESCTWCRRFDESTLRDPRVIRKLNEQFIPVKLDGNHNPKFVQALNIHAYPALVFGTADGVVLGTSAGFVDVADFLRKCDTALALCPAPVVTVSEKPKKVNHWEYDIAMIVRVCASLEERIAAEYLRESEAAINANDAVNARLSLAKVLTMGADTKAAAIARRHLERLNESPAAATSGTIVLSD